MARSNGGKIEDPVLESSVISADLEDAADLEDTEAPADADLSNVSDIQGADNQTIDDCLNALKSLLSTVEKLQKVRLEVGDVKPFLIRMLDGEVMSGEDLEQLKAGVGGLSRLIRAYGDHQTALTKAQPARNLLDQVLNYSQNQPKQK